MAEPIGAIGTEETKEPWKMHAFYNNNDQYNKIKDPHVDKIGYFLSGILNVPTAVTH